MDKFDNKIITLLRGNARLSVSELARQVNLSRSAVTARIQRLEAERVILGYHAEIAQPDTSSAKIQAYLALKFDTTKTRHYCDHYAPRIYQIEGVKWCHAISGETDMMLFVEVESMAQLYRIRDELYTIPELCHLVTHTVLTEFFNTLHDAQ